MSKKDDLSILNSIYQNGKMASECIDKITVKCDNEKLKDYIQKQRMHYDNSCDKVAEQIRSLGGEPAEPPKSQLVMADMGIEMKTMADRTGSNIAKIMYNGTNMGIIDISETLNSAKDADENIINQAKQLLSAEERYAHGLKGFL